jgi:hypothetical protein
MVDSKAIYHPARRQSKETSLSCDFRFVSCLFIRIYVFRRGACRLVLAIWAVPLVRSASSESSQSGDWGGLLLRDFRALCVVTCWRSLPAQLGAPASRAAVLGRRAVAWNFFQFQLPRAVRLAVGRVYSGRHLFCSWGHVLQSCRFRRFFLRIAPTMANNGIKIKDLARELGITPRELIDRCRAEGFFVQNGITKAKIELERRIREWYKSEDSAPSE